ncbi:MAG: hypothetical protein Q9182_002075 [Xanthomendoza sp. 2 TL-2023]
MTKKKSQASQKVAVGSDSKADHPPNSSTKGSSSSSTTPITPGSSQTPKIPDSPSTSALIICQVLESLAYSNYALRSPRPINSAVFFDLVKVRQYVEEATDLAVRATSGTASSSMRVSPYSGNGMLGGGGAAALGLGFGGASHTKLSRERRQRMRELATQKLSQAYHLDEIAASVATMQSASSLEEVAKLVLQRNPNDSDAKYVHFFHEKIPSRMLAESTSLEPLNEIIRNRPTDSAILRTRAVTKIFKNEFAAAAEDLTEALALSRYAAAQHKKGRGRMELSNVLGGAEKKTGGSRDWLHNVKTEGGDQPSSLEPQLLFHRAGVYLALACQNINISLDNTEPKVDPSQNSASNGPHVDLPMSQSSSLARAQGLEARKSVKTYAKRALRDFLSFLVFFEYSPGVPAGVAEEYMRQFDAAASCGKMQNAAISGHGLPKAPNKSTHDNATSPIALVPYEQHGSNRQSNGISPPSHPQLPSLKVYRISDLFAPSPPADLQPYPVASREIVKAGPRQKSSPLDDPLRQAFALAGCNETIGYHPLLTEVLHSLLLCHSLVQTSPKEHLRHAHMVARLARLCDGYPIFLTARSPSRADWMEVVRRADNWIGLEQTWESLCAPAPLPGNSEQTPKQRTPAQDRERRRQQAIEDSLADENVHDEATFQAAVAARERLAEELAGDPSKQNPTGPRRLAQADGKEYPITTERAAAIARWVKEAPLTVPGSGKSKRGAKKGKTLTQVGEAHSESMQNAISKSRNEEAG